MGTVRTLLGLLACVGALVGPLTACGDDGGTEGQESACPSEGPSVTLASFQPSPEPAAAGLHDVALGFDVANDSPQALRVNGIDVRIAGQWHTFTWPNEADPLVPADDSVRIERIAPVAASSPDIAEPVPAEIVFEWEWEGGLGGSCSSPDVSTPPGPGDPSTTTSAPTTITASPSPPPDALALGETATFVLVDGQEIRVTVTDSVHGGDCSAPDAPPAQNGEYLFLTVGLEISPGPEGWVMDASDFDAGVDSVLNPVTNNASLCAGSSPYPNTLTAGPGQAVEGLFVFDTAPTTSVTYRFEAYQAEERSAAWAV